MLAVLNAAPTLIEVFTLPSLVTLMIAIIALVGIAVYLRRLRTAGNLTLANGSVGGGAAALVLAVALLASVSLGATSSVAATGTPIVTPVVPIAQVTSVYQPTTVYQPIDVENLEGIQLPTE